MHDTQGEQGTQGPPRATSARRRIGIGVLAIGLVLGLGATVQAGPVGIPTLEPLDGGGSTITDEAAPMSIAATEVTLTAYLDALIAGDPYASYLANDVVLTIVGGGEEIVGLAAVTEAIDGMHYEMFDARPELTMIMFGEGQAALEANFVATQTGEFAGFAPAGGTVNVPYSVFYELAGDKITALRAYGLLDGLIQQLSSRTSDWGPPPQLGPPGSPF